MSRSRAIAFLTSVFAAMAMTLGLTAFTATAASATPGGHYPPPPPSLVVNKGVVKKGVSVRATGRKYAGKEKVTITVTFRKKGSHRYKTVKTAVLRADRNGKFTYNVKTFQAGILIITAKGKSSRKSASAAIYVIDKKKGGGWNIRRASYTAGTTAGPVGNPVSATGTPAQPNGTWLAIAGLGVLALAGSTIVTRRTIRRRKHS
ncbi:hypothetical protein Asp14428_56690 [Actinoplanes sp. NBRC 14428]|uniref:LPXTG-motif cell wall-anchored protein n=1 Tax=Pseudosporangium ferrugineum TaxID=439699 RepID=A0A2T0RDK5_9ACTN|nr:hypothetical protein [Pseudosporangium ferrugineum]PRY19264.1 hypothetical protein CLV70_13627 [Pseudosporangium ferrugineum]BCJ54194.1 hypothetical protein Asp14428_56690 [Actinoplanes sp. NBRC 14428]